MAVWSRTSREITTVSVAGAPLQRLEQLIAGTSEHTTKRIGWRLAADSKSAESTRRGVGRIRSADSRTVLDRAQFEHRRQFVGFRRMIVDAARAGRYRSINGSVQLLFLIRLPAERRSHDQEHGNRDRHPLPRGARWI